MARFPGGVERTSEDRERDDLAALRARRLLSDDEARPEAVERRHEAGGRTARENIEDLVDPSSFVEYGRFAIAAQRGRRERSGPDREDSGRRPDRRYRADQRRAVRRCRRLCGPHLRLHGAGRDPGRSRAPQEGPAVRADRADAAADRLLRRGWGRAARRHRLPGRLGPRHAGVRALGEALGPGAADRGRRRALLRRQRGDRRLRRPDRRDREHLARDGRPGDDRGRRARGPSPPTSRPDLGPGAQRRRRCRGRRRGRGDRGREEAGRLLPGRDAGGTRARSDASPRPRPRARAARLCRSRRSSRRSPTRAR